MVAFQMGKYQSLLESNGEFSRYINEHAQNNKTEISEPVMDMTENQSTLHPLHPTLIKKEHCNDSKEMSKSEKSSKQEKGKLVKAENVQTSSVKRNVYIYYLKSMGFKIMTTAFISLILIQVDRQYMSSKQLLLLKTLYFSLFSLIRVSTWQQRCGYQNGQVTQSQPNLAKEMFTWECMGPLDASLKSLF